MFIYEKVVLSNLGCELKDYFATFEFCMWHFVHMKEYPCMATKFLRSIANFPIATHCS
jgi:hypothetical protein